MRGPRPPVPGEPSRSAGPSPGMRVPWGAHFDMGVSIKDAMRRSEALGVRVVDYSREVRHVVRPRDVG